MALFRGINVGGKNILPMKELVAVLEGLKLGKVQTYIQSGNVIFQVASDSTRELAKNIGAAVFNSHEFTPRVLVLPLQEFRNAIASNPFPEGESDPKSLHLFFLESLPANPDVKRLEYLKSSSERFRLIGSIFYLHAPEGIGRSRLAANAEKALGVAATARNWRSVGAILSLATKAAS